MESIGISEFKARCIAILKGVHAGDSPLTVTYRGKPLVRIEPIQEKQRTLGALREDGRIVEELVGFDFGEDWEFES
ncbi:MAG: type II toxin-antitoxin system Phd/YefM family antitoxin [Vulcanimicrobiota bacterium]